MSDCAHGAARQCQTLPEKDQSILRSTQILTTLAQIVSELLQNSIDAAPSHIDVGVDPNEWACWVRDDGIGMGRSDIRHLGSGSKGRYGKSSGTLESAMFTALNLIHLLRFGPSSDVENICANRVGRKLWTLFRLPRRRYEAFMSCSKVPADGLPHIKPWRPRLTCRAWRYQPGMLPPARVGQSSRRWASSAT